MGQGAVLCKHRQCGARRTSIADHMRTDVGPFAIEEVQTGGDIDASTDPINKVVGAWVTRR